MRLDRQSGSVSGLSTGSAFAASAQGVSDAAPSRSPSETSGASRIVAIEPDAMSREVQEAAVEVGHLDDNGYGSTARNRAEAIVNNWRERGIIDDARHYVDVLVDTGRFGTVLHQGATRLREAIEATGG
jgi:hypothetical protein